MKIIFNPMIISLWNINLKLCCISIDNCFLRDVLLAIVLNCIQIAQIFNTCKFFFLSVEIKFTFVLDAISRLNKRLQCVCVIAEEILSKLFARNFIHS